MKISTRWIGGKKGIKITLMHYDTKIENTIFDLPEAEQLLNDAKDLILELTDFIGDRLNDR